MRKVLSFMLISLWGVFLHDTIYISMTHAEAVILIVNKNVDQSELSQQEVRDIYLGDKTTWDNGRQVVIATLKEGVVHDEFLQVYVKKTAVTFSRYWKRLLMTGKSEIPISFVTEQEVLDYVTKTEGAIGYISPALLTESVRKITIN